MENDRVNLYLGGKVSLEEFSDAVDALRELLAALTKQAEGGESVTWFVSKLSNGSAAIEATPRSDTASGRKAARLAVNRFDGIAQSASLGRFSEIDPFAIPLVMKMTAAINGRIPEVRMGSGNGEWVIKAPVVPQTDVAETDRESLKPRSSRTSVKGRIVLLEDKNALYFTLMEAFTKRFIRCYPSKDRRSDLASMWAANEWVLVEGTFNRFTNPATMQDITDIVSIGPADPGGWRKAFGVAPRAPDGSGENAADVLKRIRDAG